MVVVVQPLLLMEVPPDAIECYLPVAVVMPIHVLKYSILLLSCSLRLQLGTSSKTLLLKPSSNHQNNLVSRMQTAW